MRFYNELPYEWFNLTKQHYFLTYYGDIYPGFIAAHDDYDEGFFIIPSRHTRDFYELSRTNIPIEKYKEIGTEIQDKNIIKAAIPVKSFTGVQGRSDSIAKGYEHIWKKMFVFGAGASSNCVFGNQIQRFKESVLCPPLGPDLFHHRFDSTIKNYKGAKLSIPGFEAKGNDIELCLEDEWTTIKNSYSPNLTARHTNLQFYLADLFRQVSHDVTSNHYRTNIYSLFATKLHDYLAKKSNERIALVSFNYDTILEYFLKEAFRIEFKTLKDYIDWGTRQVVLFKPHGSCNWGWKFKTQEFTQNQLNIATSLYDTNKQPFEIYYELLGDLNEMVYAYSTGLERTTGANNSHGRFSVNKDKIEIFDESQYGYLPALLMPYKDKDEFVMPYNHHHALRFYANEMEELYLIGWKGNEEVFNRLIALHAKNLKKIVIVNPNNQEVVTNMSQQLDMKRYKVEIVNTFEEFVLKKLDNILQS